VTEEKTIAGSADYATIADSQRNRRWGEPALPIPSYVPTIPSMALTAIDRLGYNRRSAADASNLRSAERMPATDLDQGLERIVTWYQQHRDWWHPLVSP
jgi:hypothetical protein